MHFGGAQELYGIRPDLSIFAKALGAGFPVAAVAGRRDIMELFASGGVNHSGTYNANIVSLSAALAALRELSANGQAAYERIQCRRQDTAGRQSLRLDVVTAPICKSAACRPPSHTCFAGHPIHDYVTYSTADQKRLGRFLAALLERGVRPTSRGTWFVSSTHTDDDVKATLDAVDSALRQVS